MTRPFHFADMARALTVMTLLCACATPTHLLFYQGTVLGVDVSVAADGSTVHATLGYDRQTGALVPKTTLQEDSNGPEEPEAMSAVARTRIKIRWLGVQEICERFATGKAARNIASKASALNALATAKQNGSTPSTCEDF